MRSLSSIDEPGASHMKVGRALQTYMSNEVIELEV